MTQTVGILALQGDFAEHEAMLRRMGGGHAAGAPATRPCRCGSADYTGW